jgi:hypothetical protein
MLFFDLKLYIQLILDGGNGRMKKRTLSVIDMRMSVIVAILLIVIIESTVKGMAVAIVHSENDNIVDCFYESVDYEPGKGLLSFTIPETIPEGYRFYLHVSGRIFRGDKYNGRSFHAFDKESLNYTWENGKTYTYPLMSDGLDFIELSFGLQEKSNKTLIYEYTIHILHDGTKNIYKGV